MQKAELISRINRDRPGGHNGGFISGPHWTWNEHEWPGKRYLRKKLREEYRRITREAVRAYYIALNRDPLELEYWPWYDYPSVQVRWDQWPDTQPKYPYEYPPRELTIDWNYDPYEDSGDFWDELDEFIGRDFDIEFIND